MAGQANATSQPPLAQRAVAAWQRLVDHLPSQCFVCQRWPSPWLCANCSLHHGHTVVRRCPRCALTLPATSDVCPDCLRDAPVLRHCHAAVDYSPPWDRLVLQFKFHQQLAWARHMAQLTLQSPIAEQALTQADVILPIPLSSQRLRERGYNQAVLLAQALQRKNNNTAPIQPHWLLRINDTPAQAQLGRAARLRNLRHAFALEPQYAPLLAGKQVLLIDDVMTTGATLSTVANLLLSHGASEVDAMIFARTPRTP